MTEWTAFLISFAVGVGAFNMLVYAINRILAGFEVARKRDSS